MSAEQVFQGFRDAYARSNEIARRIGDPETETARLVHGERSTLRWVLAHLLVEQTRHAGHADIIREQIDGTTGR